MTSGFSSFQGGELGGSAPGSEVGCSKGRIQDSEGSTIGIYGVHRSIEIRPASFQYYSKDSRKMFLHTGGVKTRCEPNLFSAALRLHHSEIFSQIVLNYFLERNRLVCADELVLLQLNCLLGVSQLLF